MKTALYDWHLAQGAKMVSFAGYDMPVQYTQGVLREHLHVREKAGLFDVSHMGQMQLHGDEAVSELEKLVPGDIHQLAIGQQLYSLFTNIDGGVIDDLMILKRADCLQLVVNAACKEQDLAHLNRHLAQNVTVTVLDEQALLALQGPRAKEVLVKDIPELEMYKFMQGFDARINGIDCLVTRSGYTGEDGFEIACHNSDAIALADYLNAHELVAPIGLGARDSLRLEAGLCLYGNDLTAEITPVEANLRWTIGKTRRDKESANFLGSSVILDQLATAVTRRRVGLDIQSRVPVREHVEISTADGQRVGEVCSGGFSPSLEKPIAMAYIDSAFAAIDTQLYAQVRKKQVPVSVCKLPFVAHGYYR